VIAEHVVVVGGGLGGARVVEQLRSGGYLGRLTLIGAEQHPPYDRPPLSKQVLLGAWEPERVAFWDQARQTELAVTLRLGVPAVALRGTSVELADGSSIQADAVVLATGVIARRIPGQPSEVRTLRHLDDAIALRSALAGARSLLLVGGGFIGAEVAHAARVRGLDVTVLEALSAPCERVLGARVGALAGRLITAAGVDLRCGVMVRRFVDGRTVELSDGSTLSADVVLLGIGSVPALAWLDGTGFDTSNGLACDDEGRVVGAERVWALGDMAAWLDPVRGRRHRSEHWTSTVDQSVVVARSLLGLERPAHPVPYVWSDQFGLKIQVAGHPDLADDVVLLHGEGLSGGPVAGTLVGYFSSETLVAVVGFGAGRQLIRYRPLLAAGADRATVLGLATPAVVPAVPSVRTTS
jgi:NADPH-dependent 2,4-dienoyl-CoA reductase/sulfur reductase-like enzyme